MMSTSSHHTSPEPIEPPWPRRMVDEVESAGSVNVHRSCASPATLGRTVSDENVPGVAPPTTTSAARPAYAVEIAPDRGAARCRVARIVYVFPGSSRVAYPADWAPTIRVDEAPPVGIMRTERPPGVEAHAAERTPAPLPMATPAGLTPTSRDAE